ncbi:uncharacterized protein BO97DRAFT_1692 [Aspergillus homomorphus CBS 101889]|uniref:Uncharacterized protein n=1 Tax=Aspergillus homomorphus (strain CBS 101889) TaxID=1450537 RepID=A0A395IAJ8_ASPHC|nr:hypothetical protein BO97DRAFT_1692 [Aspergillus homomorphus CBS 101889]RAL17197.1 hypothetical protein BO97DRAFT_1692 [Aspergillus homomorphus CBS 101889]
MRTGNRLCRSRLRGSAGSMFPWRCRLLQAASLSASARITSVLDFANGRMCVAPVVHFGERLNDRSGEAQHGMSRDLKQSISYPTFPPHNVASCPVRSTRKAAIEV